jgi:hypothetical protein
MPGGTQALKSLGCAKRASSGGCEGVKKIVYSCEIPPNIDEITIFTMLVEFCNQIYPKNTNTVILIFDLQN